MSSQSRRAFLRSVAIRAPGLGALAPLLLRASDSAPDEKLPPVRQLTKGPRHHWFGYYDKFQFSPDNRFVLANEVFFLGCCRY